MNNTDIAFCWEKNMKHLQSGGFGPVEQPKRFCYNGKHKKEPAIHTQVRM